MSDNTQQTPQEKPFFLSSVQETAARLETDAENGLKESAIAALQARDGPNELSGGGGVNAWSIFAAQILNAMMLVLVICLAVSFGALADLPLSLECTLTSA